MTGRRPTAALRREVADRLSAAGVASPTADADLLVAHVLGVPRGRLGTADPLDGDQLARLDALVARRAAREPLQHLTGTTTFRHVDLEVGPGVFVPRPETEVLAGWAVEQAGRHDEAVVVDLCTGSGAIAAALADEVRSARVHAVEISPEAHAYAARNLAGTGVDLRLGDAADAFPELAGAVDVVVANPPYIPLAAYEEVEPEARLHDPAVALWSGDDGLTTIRVVARTAARLLHPGGLLGCEHADVQGAAAVAVLAADQETWSDVHDHHDLVGRPRFVTARRR